MKSATAENLHVIANNLDMFAGNPRRYHLADKQTAGLINNALYLRKAAHHVTHLETQMGAFATKIHAVEKERDDAKTALIAAQADKAAGDEAIAQLAALTAAGKIADDADVAAITDDPEDATPPAPVIPSAA